MSISFNCDCDVAFPTKTLADLRTMVREGLGFIDPISFANPRTLAELIADVTDRLGFMGEIGINTLALVELRTAVRNRLGLAGYVNTNVLSVANMLADLYNALGMGAISANPPPGVKQTLITFLNQAQQMLWRRLELDQGRLVPVPSPPAPLALDSDTTTVDGSLVFTFALALAKAQFQQPDAKAYSEQAEKYLADQVLRNPPNIDKIIDSALQEAQETIYRRYEEGNIGAITIGAFEQDTDECTVDQHLLQLLTLANLKAKLKQNDAQTIMEQFERAMADSMRRAPPNLPTLVKSAIQSAYRTVLRRFEIGNSGAQAPNPLVADTDTPSCDDQPIFLLASAQIMARFKLDDAKLVMGEYETYMTDALKRSPPNATTVINRLLKTAQEVLYQRYSLFRMERFYTWTLVAGTRFYGIGENDEQTGTPACTKAIDARHVKWVGVAYGSDNTNIRPLRCGIPPEVYVSNQSGVPTHYEIRQCIEIWPNPVDGWKLVVKGNFGLDPFDQDTDTCTIDWQAIYLQALADAKATYKQPDAVLAKQTAVSYVGDLVAGSHHTRRYIPGARELPNAVRPVLTQSVI